jgi:hypothetical protein
MPERRSAGRALELANSRTRVISACTQPLLLAPPVARQAPRLVEAKDRGHEQDDQSTDSVLEVVSRSGQIGGGACTTWSACALTLSRLSTITANAMTVSTILAKTQ